MKLNKQIQLLERLTNKKVILENRTDKSVVGIILKPGYILMGEAIADDDRNGWICFPGGGMESDESIKQATKREVREETNLLVEPTSRVIVDERIPNIYFVVCRYKNGEVQFNSEFKNMQWYSINDLPWNNIYPQNKKIIEEILPK